MWNSIIFMLFWSCNFYTRNRYRNKIIPLLRIENPNLNERIMQFRDYIESADLVLDRIKTEFIEKYINPFTDYLYNYRMLQ